MQDLGRSTQRVAIRHDAPRIASWHTSRTNHRGRATGLYLGPRGHTFAAERCMLGWHVLTQWALGRSVGGRAKLLARLDHIEGSRDESRNSTAGRPGEK